MICFNNMAKVNKPTQKSNNNSGSSSKSTDLGKNTPNTSKPIGITKQQTRSGGPKTKQ